MGLGHGIADFYGLTSQAFVAIHLYKTVFLFIFISKPDESIALTISSIVQNHWNETQISTLIYNRFIGFWEITTVLPETLTFSCSDWLIPGSKCPVQCIVINIRCQVSNPQRELPIYWRSTRRARVVQLEPNWLKHGPFYNICCKQQRKMECSTRWLWLTDSVPSVSHWCSEDNFGGGCVTCYRQVE